MSTPQSNSRSNLDGDISLVCEQVRVQGDLIATAAALLSHSQAEWRRSSSQIAGRLTALRARLMKY